MPLNEYKIVRDNYLGYEVQIRRWWLPIWYQANWTNTFRNVEEAEQFAKTHASNRGSEKYLGRLGSIPEAA